MSDSVEPVVPAAPRAASPSVADDAAMQVDAPVDESAAAAEKPVKSAKGKGKAAGPKKPVQTTGEPGKSVLPAVRCCCLHHVVCSQCAHVPPASSEELPDLAYARTGSCLADHQGAAQLLACELG